MLITDLGVLPPGVAPPGYPPPPLGVATLPEARGVPEPPPKPEDLGVTEGPESISYNSLIQWIDQCI